jgi:MinD superfamily P-loop ATPase
VTLGPDSRASIDPLGCEGCGVCVRFCPAGAIAFPERRCGEWYVSDTRFGSLVHARLGVAAENSGKLVSLVRREARKLAEQQGSELLLVDGPPGIGCAVIASVTGADTVVVVTEPTVSGSHDLRRVLELIRHFGLKAGLVINKWDINPELAGQIEAEGLKFGARLLGRISYDPNVTAAQIRGLSLIEHAQGPCVAEVAAIWERLCSQD